MSSNQPNKNISYQGTNSQGNNYTKYESGAYRYTNYGSNAEKPASQYYDTGKGHSFYRQNNTAEAKGYTYHENQNQGFRTYTQNGGSSGKKWGDLMPSTNVFLSANSSIQMHCVYQAMNFIKW